MLTVSIVTYNTDVDELRECFRSLDSPVVDSIVVIDNSSNDSIRQLCAATPKVRYIGNKNVGYGRAHNLALRESLASGQQYHLVLNSDVSFKPAILSEIIAFMDQNPDVGTLQPAVFYPDGRPQYTCRLLPTPLDLMTRRFLPEKWVTGINHRYLVQEANRDQTLNLPQHQGSFMFMRVDALRNVGIFDERYFLYGEDVDLSRRIHSRYRTLYWPKVSIVHKHREESYYKLKPLTIHMVNLFRYFCKWGWFYDPERRRWNRDILRNLKK